MEQTNLPRGIRNNNPLNLRKSNNNWLGKVVNGDDPAFEQFMDIRFGIRAAMINARTICRRQYPCTIESLIYTWAPPSDGNNSKAYVDAVCKRANLGRNYVVSWKERDKFIALIRAMAVVECGEPIKFQLFEDAYEML